MTGGKIKYDKEKLQHSKTGLTKTGVQNPVFVHTYEWKPCKGKRELKQTKDTF